MISIRKASERGHLNFGRLDAKHTFSFGSYLDPAHMGFRSLRVMNNDTIAPEGGFKTHPHKNMEIITFILEGQLEHRDTMGNHSIINPGEIQIMSAGSGVFHSEFNPSSDQATKLYQIWIKPSQMNIEPRYEQYSFKEHLKVNRFIDLVTTKGGEGVVKIYQDASVKYGVFEHGETFSEQLNLSKGYWVQIISGSVEVNGNICESEDGISIEENNHLDLSFLKKSELLIFELG